VRGQTGPITRTRAETRAYEIKSYPLATPDPLDEWYTVMQQSFISDTIADLSSCHPSGSLTINLILVTLIVWSHPIQEK
jgi:antitoxin component HigA of HigAB toxin-antitoxin module